MTHEELRATLVTALFDGLVPVDRGPENLRVLDADASADAILAALGLSLPEAADPDEPEPYTVAIARSVVRMWPEGVRDAFRAALSAKRGDER